MSRIRFNRIKTSTYFIRQFSLNITITRFDELSQFEMSVLRKTPNIMFFSQKLVLIQENTEKPQDNSLQIETPHAITRGQTNERTVILL